jgi:cytochrome P450
MLGFWTRPLAFLEWCRARYGRRFTVRLPLTPPFVMLCTPEEIKEVFTAPADVLHPGAGASVLEPVVGRNSVILLDGDAHMEQRRLMLPAFHGERIAGLSTLVETVAEQAVSAWPSDRPVALHERLQDATLEIILRTVFGLEPGPCLDALRERLRAMLRFGEKPISLMPPPPDGRAAKVLERVGPFAPFVRMQREADELIFTLVDERRGTRVERDDVLAMLLAARHEDGAPMSDQELRDELMTLLVAGHETTASTLAWAFDRLSRHAEVVRRLREDDDDAYLTATVQEVLRHRPVLPNVAPRLVMKPIRIGGQSYPRGVCLVPNAYLLHHDPDIYSEPYAFRPERFLEQQPGTYTWIPFGGGKRRCLGASFAMLEMKLMLKTVLRQREVEPTGDRFELPRRRNITIRPGDGCRVRLPVWPPERERTPSTLAVSAASG